MSPTSPFLSLSMLSQIVLRYALRNVLLSLTLSMHPSLQHHLEDGHASVMFPLHSVPTVEAYESLREAEIQRRAAATQLEEQPEKVTRSVDTYAAVQNLAKDLDIQLGELHHVTMPAPLTEQEAEYTVEIVKHLWSNTKFVSFELSVANTVKDQVRKRLCVIRCDGSYPRRHWPMWRLH